ncbi:MAG: hypothetical protein QME71_04175 [Dehalococcoidia bacterium]|nr:hypothetical protein [Dehalococcoidia bacterium]
MRGGRRSGAGAPRGNLNALKHGRRSQQLQRLFYRALNSPDADRALQNLHRAVTLIKAGVITRGIPAKPRKPGRPSKADRRPLSYVERSVRAARSRGPHDRLARALERAG